MEENKEQGTSDEKELDKKSTKKIKKKRTLFRKIINVFIFIFLGIFFIILLALGFTQTSTFRGILKDNVIKIANAELNGKLNIERIDGTIFTSLLLHNTSIKMGNDTLFWAKLIELRTSPLQLLFKKIYIRKIEIKEGAAHLIADENGVLNVTKLMPPSETKDTSKSTFNFVIEAPDVKLTNFDFSLRNYNTSNNTNFYDTLNLNDLRINDFNLYLYAWANIDKNDFKLRLFNMNASSNINQVGIKHIAGNFDVNEGGINIQNFQINTLLSRLKLNAQVKNYNMFDTTADYTTANLDIDFTTDKFNFADVRAISPSMNMMGGEIYTNFKAAGTFKELIYDNLEVSFQNTHMQAAGSLKNLDAPSNMYIIAAFKDTYINQNDIAYLFPRMNVPVYKDYGVLRFDTLYYEGKTNDFKTIVKLNTDKGSLFSDAKLNFANPLMTYDVVLRANNLSLQPITNSNIILNTNGTVKGVGTDPANMNAVVKLNASGSVYEGNTFNNLTLDADATNRLINFNLFAAKDTTSVNFKGSADFNDQKNPSYIVAGLIERVNLFDYTKDSSLITNLNLKFNAEGVSFDPDAMNLFATLEMYESQINQKTIDSTMAIIDVRTITGEPRIINIISDIADITFSGNFTIAQVGDLITDETSLLTSVINEKLNEFNPEAVKDTIAKINTNVTTIKNKNKISKKNADLDVKYLVDFKDFQLASLFLGEGTHLEIDGFMSGDLYTKNNQVFLTYNTFIDYLKYWNDESVIFMSKFNLDFELNNNLNSKSFESIYANLQLNTERVFAGSDIKDIYVNLKLDKAASSIALSANLDNTTSANLNGNFTFNDQMINLNLDTLNIHYKDLTLFNKEIIQVGYSDGSIDIKSFVLGNEYGDLSLNGIYNNSGNNDLTIKLNKIQAGLLGTTFMNLRPENNIAGVINMNTHITGTAVLPIIDLTLNIDSVTYKNHNFGSFVTKMNYESQNLFLDLRFLDSTINNTDPALLITGNIPINMGFTGVEERFPAGRPLDASLKAENFNLGALGDLAPGVNKLRGFFNADLQLGGTIKEIDPNGFVNLRDAGFLLETNNLEYNVNMHLAIDNDNLLLDTLSIENAGDIEGKGRMFGHGSAKLSGLSLVSSNFEIDGDLKVLSDESRSGTIGMYGDLVVGTKGKVEFTFDEEKMFLQAPIVIKDANVTIPPSASAYQNKNQYFIYKFVEDTVDTAFRSYDFESLVELSKHQAEKEKSKGKSSTLAAASGFEYKISVEIEDEATVNFILAKELNQSLTAVLKGNIDYESIGGDQNAQGEFELLEGSTLQFIKTFTADGSVKFESDIANPYLNIEAVYQDYYYPSDSSAANSVEEVVAAVKIKIIGPLKELDKNFINQEDNIAVYYGQENIEDDEPDPTKDASDALMFIVTGRFKDDLTQSERSSAAGQFQSTATSIAGSVIGGVLNNYMGDYVRDVELRQVGTDTRFNLSGRFKKLRYTVGGSTQVFEDISQANIRFEYPILDDFLIRMERKEDITETGITNKMINELGLKYRFEF